MQAIDTEMLKFEDICFVSLHALSALLGLQSLSPEGAHSTKGSSAGASAGASSEVRQQPNPQQPNPMSLPGGNCTSEYMQHIFWFTSQMPRSSL